MEEYVQHCEGLYRRAIKGGIELEPRLRRLFQLDHISEPFVFFDDQESPLVFLTTNPGAGMEHQEIARLQSGESPVSGAKSYRELAGKMSKFYEERLTGAAARRVHGVRRLARAAGYSGVFQIESVPFHSRVLPGKARLPAAFGSDRLLCRYMESVSRALIGKPVLILSAASSRKSLSPQTLQESPWLLWQAAMAGMNVGGSIEFHALVTKSEKITGGAIVDRSGAAPRVFVLMMGGNNLPGEAGLGKLVELLKVR